MSVIELIDNIVTKYDNKLKSQISTYPRERFVASDIGDCDRAMCYSILNWSEKKLFNTYVQALLNMGKEHESRVLRDLMELGFEVIDNQATLDIKNRSGVVICRLKIDGKIRFEKKKYPFEIKTMNINNFNSIRSIDDFQKKRLYRKYLRQIQMYLYGTNSEEGVLILTDLQGHYKILPIYLDLGECELILRRLESNWEFVQKKQLPDRIEYNPQLCEHCDFSHVCLPDINTKPATMINDQELIDQLNRRSELVNLAKEYELIDKEVKERFKQITEPVIIGTDYMIETKKQIKNSVDIKSIPDEIKNQHIEHSEVITVKIISLSKENKNIGD